MKMKMFSEKRSPYVKKSWNSGTFFVNEDKTDIIHFLVPNPISYSFIAESLLIHWVLHHRRVLYLKVVALQMAYCTYLFKDSVAKI